ncbi:XRE family transcriptional regulator [Olsenella sp. SW781]|nr:XRE family transcriptional regulator [Olsenella sp. SW781]
MSKHFDTYASDGRPHNGYPMCNRGKRGAMDVGTRIREHREAAGMRQDQLAELCRVSRQTISNWERNKTLPDVVSLKVMAHELGTTVDALIGDDIPEIRRRADSEARRFLTLYLLNLAFMLASDVMNMGSNWGGHAFDAPVWTYLRAAVAGAWLVVLVPYVRLVRRHRFAYIGEIGRYLDKNLVLEESRVTRVARSMLRHIQVWNGVLLTLAALAGLAAGGVLTPGMAACLVAVCAALVALGVHLDKERQRWGGSVNPPLPPQR